MHTYIDVKYYENGDRKDIVIKFDSAITFENELSYEFDHKSFIDSLKNIFEEGAFFTLQENAAHCTLEISNFNLDSKQKIETFFENNLLLNTISNQIKLRQNYGTSFIKMSSLAKRFNNINALLTEAEKTQKKDYSEHKNFLNNYNKVDNKLCNIRTDYEQCEKDYKKLQKLFGRIKKSIEDENSLLEDDAATDLKEALESSNLLLKTLRSLDSSLNAVKKNHERFDKAIAAHRKKEKQTKLSRNTAKTLAPVVIVRRSVLSPNNTELQFPPDNTASSTTHSHTQAEGHLNKPEQKENKQGKENVITAHLATEEETDIALANLSQKTIRLVSKKDRFSEYSTSTSNPKKQKKRKKRPKQKNITNTFFPTTFSAFHNHASSQPDSNLVEWANHILNQYITPLILELFGAENAKKVFSELDTKSKQKYLKLFIHYYTRMCRILARCHVSTKSQLGCQDIIKYGDFFRHSARYIYNSDDETPINELMDFVISIKDLLAERINNFLEKKPTENDSNKSILKDNALSVRVEDNCLRNAHEPLTLTDYILDIIDILKSLAELPKLKTGEEADRNNLITHCIVKKKDTRSGRLKRQTVMADIGELGTTWKDLRLSVATPIQKQSLKNSNNASDRAQIFEEIAQQLQNKYPKFFTKQLCHFLTYCNRISNKLYHPKRLGQSRYHVSDTKMIDLIEKAQIVSRKLENCKLSLSKSSKSTNYNNTPVPTKPPTDTLNTENEQGREQRTSSSHGISPGIFGAKTYKKSTFKFNSHTKSFPRLGN